MRQRSIATGQSLALLLAVALCLLVPPALSAAPDGVRMRDLTAEWQFDHRPVLGGFHNLYNARIVEVLDKQYPFRMWFFGWPVADNNPVGGRFIGDAIYHARSADLQGWEVYAGEDARGGRQWDTTMNPELWVPVVSGLDKGFENAIAGDPAVVKRGNWYYMAFSSVWFESHAEMTPQHMWVIGCIMGARSRDGIRWERTREPILIWPKEHEIHQDAAGGVFKLDPGYCGSYHRPSLMFDEGRWKLWFDYMLPGTFVSLGYAENDGDFMDPKAWRVLNEGERPQLRDWPNASVVRVGNRYYNFCDAPGYPGEMGQDGRQITMAESPDGKTWTVLGHIRPEGKASSHVPEAFVRREGHDTWLYVFYAWKPELKPGEKWDYRYKETRYMRRKVG